MGRFSKLETGVSPTPDDVLKVRRPADAADDEDGIVYDVLHYQTEGDKLFFSGEYKRALRMYSRAIQADHAAVAPWVGQVLCLLELKQFKEAHVWVRRGLELFPDESRLISLQGAVYASQGMVQRGLGSSDFALSIASSDPLVWIIRGEILALAENKNSEFCFDKAIESSARDDWQTRVRIGTLLIRQKKWAKAGQYLKAAAQLNSGNDFLWERLGFVNEQLGLTQAALESYNTARDMNPANQVVDSAIKRLTTTNVFVRAYRRLFG